MLKDSIVQMDGCCERTATGNATAVPASSLMNSRRLMHDPPCGRLGFLFARIFHSKQLRPRHSPFDPRSTLLVCNSPTAPDPHPHMLRHACGFRLANDGHDTRALQHYLGHKNIQHTVRYTEMAPDRFKDFWRSY
jgi:integrase